MSSPATDVATVIDSAVAALTLNTNLFAHEMRVPGRGIPQQAVFCLTTGGPTPEAYLTNAVTPEVRRPVVQVMVRSNPHDFSGGQSLARSVKDAVHSQAVSGYIAAKVREAEPTYLNQETNGSYVWSMNVDLIVEE